MTIMTNMAITIMTDSIFVIMLCCDLQGRNH